MTVTDERPATPAPGPTPDDTGTMTLFEHLAELRTRIIVSVIALIVATIFDFMRGPLCHFLRTHPSKNLLTEASLKSHNSCGGGALYVSGPLEGFTTRLKVSAYCGAGLCAPVLFYELWSFITPGLKDNEKRYVVPFVAAATVLFAMGVTTSILVFPKALTWLLDVGGSVTPLLSPQKYFTLYVTLALVFGVVFMYPLIVVGLELTGVVPSARWRKWRRPAIVVIAAIAAIITPSSDPFSFLALCIPMLIFYEASIILGRILGK
jgi:sec-independent protein translocase protein TatC